MLALLVSPLHAQQSFKLQNGQWQAQQTLDPKSPEGKLQAIREQLAKDHGRTAQNLAEDWLEEYPDHPLAVEAHLLKADAMLARGEHYKSLFEYEYIVRVYPGSEQFQTALQREYDVALLFFSGVRRKFWGIPLFPAEGEGEELLIRIQERAPGSELGEKASIALADYYFNDSEMANAAIAYEMFLVNYPQSVQREYALLRLIRSHLATFKGPKFDATGIQEARQRILQYRKEFPLQAERLGMDDLLTRIEESIASKAFETARWYERTGKAVSAQAVYRRLVQEHSQTLAAREAMRRIREPFAPRQPVEPGVGTAALPATPAGVPQEPRP